MVIFFIFSIKLLLLFNLAFISIIIFQTQIEKADKQFTSRKLTVMLLKYTKCIYIVKIYLLRDKHLQKRQETTDNSRPGAMFGARAIQRRREKEEELKVWSLNDLQKTKRSMDATAEFQSCSCL